MCKRKRKKKYLKKDRKIQSRLKTMLLRSTKLPLLKTPPFKKKRFTPFLIDNDVV